VSGTTSALPFDPATSDPDVVGRSLGTDLARGLSSAEAAKRLATYGPNELAGAPPVPRWRKFLAQFRDPLVYLLLVAVAISLAAWLVEGAQGWPFDVIVIVLIVLANAAIGYVQEERAERAVAALQKIAAATATVVRDGEQQRVPAREVVPGDVLILAEGDTVSADARLISSSTLKVAEASLTGESEPVLKDAATLTEPTALGDRLDMVFTGTAVTQGVGRAIVTATGMATQMGQIADLLQRTKSDPTPLQREIARVGRMLGLAVVAIAVVVMATLFITSDIRTAEDAVTVLLLGVSLAVAAVPEGLPAILSVVLALGVQRMAGKNAIVKNLASVETLGSASVICTDKTGTLTKNEMTIERVVTPSAEIAVTGVGYRPDGEFEVDGLPLTDDQLRDEVEFVIGGGSLASDARLREEDGEWAILGDPTEAAFLVADRKLGITDERQARFTRVGEIPFTSDRKLMTSLEADAEFGGRVAAVTKGAPDVLLRRCTAVRVGGEVVPLSRDFADRVLVDVDRLSDQALRTLAVAYRPIEGDDVPHDESVEHDLVYLGMVGIIDPARAEATDAIAEAHRAGIRVIMITGDHPRTAARIAADLGLVGQGAPALTGPEIDAMTDEEFAVAVASVSIYARVAPEHKLRIVDALQETGHIVAMTGDGVNDAPALKSADIGVAMGITGTEVAKEAANMILVDDNFATIVTAVREGRSIYDNIKKFLRYLLSSNMGEVLTVFLGVVFAGLIGLSGDGEAIVVPLLAVQILWINLLTDTGPALALGVDPPVDDPMDRPPRALSDRVIDAAMWRGVLLIGFVMAVVSLVAIDIYLPGGLVEGSHDIANARTAGFTVLVLCQLFNCFNARSERTSAFHDLFSNHWLWAAVGLSLMLQIAVVHLPVLNDAFGTEPLTADQWLVCLGLASSVLLVDEIRKLILRTAPRHE